MINYYGRFLPKLASRLAPLYQLLRQNVRWQWKDEHKEAFRRAKEALQSSQVIIHSDPIKEVIVACDASPYGVGDVLSHRLATVPSDQPLSHLGAWLKQKGDMRR